MALYVNDHRVAGPKPWAGGVVRNEWKLYPGALDTAVGRRFEGDGYAVCIRPSKAVPDCVSWLTENGGYRAQRRERHVWAQRWEALEAARGWSDCTPIIVKVRFYTRQRTPHPLPREENKT